MSTFVQVNFFLQEKIVKILEIVNKSAKMASFAFLSRGRKHDIMCVNDVDK